MTRQQLTDRRTSYALGPLELAPDEMSVLLALAEQPVPKDKLYGRIWGGA